MTDLGFGVEVSECLKRIWFYFTPGLLSSSSAGGSGSPAAGFLSSAPTDPRPVSPSDLGLYLDSRVPPARCLDLQGEKALVTDGSGPVIKLILSERKGD